MRVFHSRTAVSLFMVTAAVLLFLQACTLHRGSDPAMQEIYGIDERPICRVAVLPFLNETNYEQGAFVVYRVFSSELTNLTEIAVVPEGDIRKIYRQKHIYPSRPLETEHLRILSDRLNVDAVITGTVTEIREEKSEESINPIIGLNVQILDTANGRILNSTYHKRDGNHYRKLMHFGKIGTLTGLSKYISREIIETWLDKGIRTCQ